MRKIILTALGLSLLIGSAEIIAASYYNTKPENIKTYHCSFGHCVERE